VFSPYSSFEAAAKEILQYLHHQFGFDLWTVSRLDGEEAIIVQAVDRRYGLQKGKAFKWSDLICKRMVEGQGPNIVPNLADAPVYLSAPQASEFSIGAYVGYPLCDSDGQVFGTLCGVATKPQPKDIEQSESTFTLYSKLLSTLLSMDLQLKSRRENSLRLDIDQLVDTETGLLSITAWNRFMATQNRRAREFGSTAYVAKVGLLETLPNPMVQISRFLRESLGVSVVMAKGNSQEILLCIPDCDEWAGEEKLSKLMAPLSQLLGQQCVYETISSMDTACQGDHA
jgi:hypothetical protein